MARVKDGRRNNGKSLERITANREIVRAGKMPQKLTIDAWKRMHDEHDFDPLAAAISIAKGEALTKDHPFLTKFIDELERWKKIIESGQQIDARNIDDLIMEGRKQLTDSWVSHELRSKHILELLQYIYPKRRAVDANINSSIQMDIQIKPLTHTEIKIFRQYFSQVY